MSTIDTAFYLRTFPRHAVYDDSGINHLLSERYQKIAFLTK